ncbi:hypothetical protein B0H14DRAFT_3866718 [Mycena olivaceomarginata]|nr:hypothetical protein B0H14DRAFT_3866718 [Mycena olivaceomarginata]
MSAVSASESPSMSRRWPHASTSRLHFYPILSETTALLSNPSHCPLLGRGSELGLDSPGDEFGAHGIHAHNSNELPLYQAIIVTDLVWLANCAIFMTLATHNRHPHCRLARSAVHHDRADVPLDGGDPVPVGARADARRGRGAGARACGDCGATRGYAVVAAIFLSHRLAGTLKQGEKMSLDPHLITLGLFILVPYVITVGSTELQIRKNHLCPDNIFWGFGQILTITVTIVPVFGTVQTFRKYGRRQSPRDLALSLDLRPSATTTTLQSTLSHINLYPTLSSIHIFAYFAFETPPLPARFIANN